MADDHAGGEAWPGAGTAQGVHHTTCCIVGAGPAGVLLALLLARQGVEVTLLEAHTTFDRDFRGNTINPSAMNLMAEVGLVDALLQLPHVKIPRFMVQTATESACFADFTRLKARYPYIMMLPQVSCLELMVAEAQRYPSFHLIMGATVRELIEEQGVIRGVRYQGRDGSYEVRASLTVSADGRYSRTRRLAGLDPVGSTVSLDLLWFYLPRCQEDQADAGAVFRLDYGGLLVLMDHFEHWQVGYIIPKGSYRQLRDAGLPALRRAIAMLAPELADRLHSLQTWAQVSLLSVESSCIRKWYLPGLLLIGDAAHPMSPVGGVGINYALQDAVVAANVLSGPLKAGQVTLRELRAIQRRRKWPTQMIQWAQNLSHHWLATHALVAPTPFTLPAFLRLCLRLPILRDLPARLIALDHWPAHVQAGMGCADANTSIAGSVTQPVPS